MNNAGVVSPQKAIQFAKANKMQVYTIGLGSDQPAIIGYDFFGNPQYAELDGETLERIAVETGGKYYKSVNERTLDDIYANIGENVEREWEDTSIKDWFFIAALNESAEMRIKADYVNGNNPKCHFRNHIGTERSEKNGRRSRGAIQK